MLVGHENAIWLRGPITPHHRPLQPVTRPSVAIMDHGTMAVLLLLPFTLWGSCHDGPLINFFYKDDSCFHSPITWGFILRGCGQSVREGVRTFINDLGFRLLFMM